MLLFERVSHLLLPLPFPFFFLSALAFFLTYYSSSSSFMSKMQSIFASTCLKRNSTGPQA